MLKKLSKGGARTQNAYHSYKCVLLQNLLDNTKNTSFGKKDSGNYFGWLMVLYFT